VLEAAIFAGEGDGEARIVGVYVRNLLFTARRLRQTRDRSQVVFTTRLHATSTFESPLVGGRRGVHADTVFSRHRVQVASLDELPAVLLCVLIHVMAM
jgi:hypothetical protein